MAHPVCRSVTHCFARRADIQRVRARLVLLIVAAAVLLGAQAQSFGAGVMALPAPGAPACSIFPANNYWHADVSTLPVHQQSGAWIASMGGPERRLHPDFGPSDGELPYGIPYAVVGASHPDVTIAFDYADESDPGPYPFGPDIPIEGGPDADGDRHALMIDRDTCTLYELFAADWNNGKPTAGSGAVFDLTKNDLRPAGWTSADAAGLPVFAGLVRRDEVLAGNVDHAIRITASSTSRAYLWPARHFASTTNNPNLPPMGAWFRMKSTFDISRYSAHTQTILRAFKKHGAIVADNGSNWYFTGAADEGWEDHVLDELKSIPAGAFEAVDASGLMLKEDSGQVKSVVAAPVTTAAPAPTTTARPAAAPTTTAGRRVPAAPSVSVTSAAPTTEPPTAAPAGTAPATTIASLEGVAGSPAAEEALDEVLAGPRRSDGRRADGSSGGVSWWLWLALLVTIGAIAVTATSIRGRLRPRRP